VSNTNSHNNSESDVKVIASSGQFKIEFINRIGHEDYPSLIKISESLVIEYGPRSLLTDNTIDIYFNREGTLPFVATTVARTTDELCCSCSNTHPSTLAVMALRHDGYTYGLPLEPRFHSGCIQEFQIIWSIDIEMQ